MRFNSKSDWPGSKSAWRRRQPASLLRLGKVLSISRNNN